MATSDLPPADVFHPGGGLRLDLLTDGATRALREAVRYTRHTGWESIRSPHVFMGLLAAADPAMLDWGKRLGIDLGDLLAQFEEFFRQDHGEPESILALHREFLSDNVLRLLRHALQRAAANGRPAVTQMDLLVTLMTASQSIVVHCFEQLGEFTTARLLQLAVLAEENSER